MVDETCSTSSKKFSSKEYGKQYYQTHKEEIRARGKIWRDNNRDKRRAQKRRYYHKHKDKWRERSNKKQRENYAKRKLTGALIRQSYPIRFKLMHLLGSDCVVCGFSDFRALEIDHKDGGGLKEVKAFGRAEKMHLFYYRHPDIAKQKLQLLCANCNVIKRYELKQHSCDGSKRKWDSLQHFLQPSYIVRRSNTRFKC